MLFQIIAPEFDKLFLNRLIFGLGIKKFLLATERTLDVVSSDIFLTLNKSIKYEGAILLVILYIIFALFKNTLSSKESILRWLRASSKCVYSKNNFTSSILYLSHFFNVKVCWISPYDPAIVYMWSDISIIK